MNNKLTLSNIFGSLFGIIVLAIGFINTFWGNDPFFGIFVLVLSFVYFPLINNFVKSKFGFAIPLIIKIVLAVFILWSSLGVGELFDKIDLMMRDVTNSN